MAELSLNLPVVGEKDTTAEPKVTTALTEIQTQFNGKVAAVNLEAKAVTDAKVAENRALVTTNGTYSAGKSYTSETEEEPSATRMSFVVLQATGGNIQNLIVGGKELGPSVVGGVTYVSFLVPPAVKWKAKTSSTSQWSALIL